MFWSLQRSLSLTCVLLSYDQTFSLILLLLFLAHEAQDNPMNIALEYGVRQIIKSECLFLCHTSVISILVRIKIIDLFYESTWILIIIESIWLKNTVPDNKDLTGVIVFTMQEYKEIAGLFEWKTSICYNLMLDLSGIICKDL